MNYLRIKTVITNNIDFVWNSLISFILKMTIDISNQFLQMEMPQKKLTLLVQATNT